MLQTNYKIQAVWVKKDDKDYIQEACNFLYDFNEKHEIYVELEDPATEIYDKNSICFSQEEINTIPFEPFSSGYDSDGEYTTMGVGMC
ncbi:hypothetical protein A1E_01520 [Rickettsia canadensis str. McKiel]|uniref:Uncharacterized protein n=1 Tax=Rickettsia canadensis (strain McKiel) TaxID=293613 RepID=A8EY16_RICCK|nr:hypothetical protein [Rickettsia canadensis]ABV73249.1 hypothetical protein A1E_01520 [Rickettsia canadensis str. McKiel]